MSFYLLLTIGTVVVVSLAVLIWRKTHSISIPIGIAMMYYWSVFGAWSIVADRLNGEAGKSYGYLEEKLFPVYLDRSYFAALVLYVSFIVVIEVCLLLGVRRLDGGEQRLGFPLRINHGVLLVLGASCGLGSYWLVKESLDIAEGLNLSGYAVTRGMLGDPIPFFTIHQILNRGAFLSAAIGFAVLCSGRDARMFVAGRSPAAVMGYALLTGCLLWFALMLGNKNELLFSGMVGALLYEANAQKKRMFGLLAVALIGLSLLRVIDTVRGLPLSSVVAAMADVEPSEWFDLAQLLFSSNEAFAAHFSLYGVLAQNIPLTYGASFVSGIASIIPRFMWPDRPLDIYYYYAEQVGAAEGQGYTIHHAAGWYLNFGIFGIIVGALVWGTVWVLCFVVWREWWAKTSRFWRICGFIAPTMFVASIPMLLRVGVEGYKGFLVEGMLLPTMILILASNQWIRSRRRPIRAE